MRKRSGKTVSEVPKMTVMQKMASSLEIPITTVADTPSIELAGNREMTVEGIKNVLEYSEDLLKLNLGKLNLTLLGKEINIRVLGDSVAVIEGYFISIEFST